MDRVMVEVLITASLLSLSAVITTSSSTIYARTLQMTEELSSEKTLYFLAGTIKGAVAASITSGKNITTSISFQNPIIIEAEGGFLKLKLANSVKSIYLGVVVEGGGKGRTFNIAASQNFVRICSVPP
ncbi:MAG: hypothetical protein N3D12_01705 [Candidatus Methanomethyliaceae archaeon]|nr:hypothetical protein [Candidatus Methanomethyliaceae archaeon]